MCGMDGYWVKRYITGRVGMVLKVINRYDMYVYRKGEWVLTNKTYPLGWDDDWDHVSEKEAMWAAEELESD